VMMSIETMYEMDKKEAKISYIKFLVK